MHVAYLLLHCDCTTCNLVSRPSDVDVPDWEPLDAIIEAVQVVVQGLVEFTQHRGSISCKVEPQMSLQNGKYKTNMCRDLSQRGHCPRGANCTFAHSEEEMCRWEDLVVGCCLSTCSFIHM